MLRSARLESVSRSADKQGPSPKCEPFSVVFLGEAGERGAGSTSGTNESTICSSVQIVQAIKTQMLSSILLAVHPSVILSVKDPGEIRCRIDSKKFFLYSKLKVNSFNSTATARLLICVVQQVSLIKPVYSFLDFKMRVFKIPLLKERL